MYRISQRTYCKKADGCAYVVALWELQRPLSMATIVDRMGASLK